MSSRVVVTGIGLEAPLGSSIDVLWGNLLAGKSGIKNLSDILDTEGLDVRIGAPVENDDSAKYIDKREARRMDRFTKLAISSSIKALADAGFEINSENENDIGIIIGSGIGGMETFEKQAEVFLKRGPGRMSPFFIPMLISNMASGQTAIYTGAKGPNNCAVTACAAGAHSIGDAMEIIKRGDAKAMLTGGSEAALTRMSIAGFTAMRALSTRNDEPSRASRPFDKERDGFVMAEGAAILLLEDLDSALKRGARIYAEISGYGSTGDAHHITAPAPLGEGAQRSMAQALKKSGLEPEDVDYINAHGTSTPYNDRTETAAIKEVFGSHANNLKVSSTKSMTGHLLGAAGALEAAITVLAIYNKQIPPTINYENPDPECDLDYVPNKAEEKEIRAALSNSLGFGGHNATLVFKSFQEG